jgi:hypothetical protein
VQRASEIAHAECLPEINQTDDLPTLQRERQLGVT